MRQKFDNFTLNRPRLKKTVGWILVAVGFLAIVTPLTPGGILFFVGLEILGLRIIFTDKIKRMFARTPKTVPLTKISIGEKVG